MNTETREHFLAIAADFVHLRIWAGDGRHPIHAVSAAAGKRLHLTGPAGFAATIVAASGQVKTVYSRERRSRWKFQAPKVDRHG